MRPALSLKIGYTFRSPELLRQALCHRSFAGQHNERLEFLGDSILNCLIALEIYTRFPRLPEGDLSRLRASLVNQQTLFELAQSIDLGEQMLLGDGELKSGGFRRPSILADALEALLGAVFLDGGFDAAHAVVRTLYAPRFQDIDPRNLGKDPKTALQEYLQGRRLPVPQYSVISTQGEAHEQRFQVECVIPELHIRTIGEGTSRRSAEQCAAKSAYSQALGS